MPKFNYQPNATMQFVNNPAAIQALNGFEDSEAGNLANVLAGANFKVLHADIAGEVFDIRLIGVLGWEGQIIYDVYLSNDIVQ